mgnify:CR=1 FL=1
MYHTAPLVYGLCSAHYEQPLVLMDRWDSERALALVEEHRAKISLFCNVPKEAVITALDARDSIYDIPMMLHAEKLDDIVIERLGLQDKATRPADLSDWVEVVDRLVNTEHEVTVGMVGKYVDHADAYKSLSEAITHGGLRQRIKVNIVYYESEDFADGGKVCAMGVRVRERHRRR